MLPVNFPPTRFTLSTFLSWTYEDPSSNSVLSPNTDNPTSDIKVLQHYPTYSGSLIIAVLLMQCQTKIFNKTNKKVPLNKKAYEIYTKKRTTRLKAYFCVYSQGALEGNSFILPDL